MSAAQRGRRVGMSKTQNPPPLLSKIKGRTTKEDVRPIDAPPAASSDEEGEEEEERNDSQEFPDRSVKANISESDDDDDRRKKNDIPKTTFTGVQRSNRSLRQPPTRSTAKDSSQLDASSNSRSSKRSADGTLEGGNDHLVDAFGFPKAALAKKARTGTGKGLKVFGSSSQPGSQKSAPRSSAPKGVNSPNKKSGGFQKIELTPSPQKLATSKAKYQTFSNAGSSPEFSPKRKSERFDSFSRESPKKTFITYKADSSKADTAREDPTPFPNALTRKYNKRRASARKTSQKEAPKLSRLPELDETSPKIGFRNHLEGLDIDFRDDVGDANVTATQATAAFRAGSLADGASSDQDLVGDSGDDVDNDDTQPFTARCPMCHSPVDPAFLKKHSKTGRMTIRKQTAFCKLHKQESAKQTRKDKGYPDIEWDCLELRFGEHEDILNDILLGRRTSHYRSLLGEKVKAGQNRTLLKTDDVLTPGYYGPRGLRVMTDYIMRTFADTVRVRAVEDRLVSARGYSGYVQAVLVPELAVRLIMEDMEASEEQARIILQESIGIGELLHEEARDIVVRGSDEED